MSNRRSGLGGEGDGSRDRGRWSSRPKMEVVLRILRGENLKSLSRELRVTAAALALPRCSWAKAISSRHRHARPSGSRRGPRASRGRCGSPDRRAQAAASCCRTRVPG